jgi:hypothetical protein
LAWKGQNFAGDVKAHVSAECNGVRDLTFQQVSGALASLLPHKTGEEPDSFKKSLLNQYVN